MSPGAQLCPAKLEPGNVVGIKGKRVFEVPEEPWDAVESPESAENADLVSFLFQGYSGCLTPRKELLTHQLALGDGTPCSV